MTGVQTCALPISPRGDLLASASDDRTVILWSTDNGEPQHLFPGDIGIVALAFSPREQTIAVGNNRAVALHPITSPLWMDDPRTLLQSTQGRAGLHLNGFALSPHTPSPGTKP